MVKKLLVLSTPASSPSRFKETLAPFVIMGNTMPPRDPNEDEEDEDEEDRADEPPVVREPDED
jgi:hypothetical protein